MTKTRKTIGVMVGGIAVEDNIVKFLHYEIAITCAETTML